MIFFILGLVFGSFITALTWRYPREISNIKGRSFCDKCKYELRWYDNIPLLSYIFLLGRCRNCKKKISVRYPVIEFVTGVIFYLIGFNIPYLILAIILISIFVIDLEHQIIPDGFIFFGFFVLPFTIHHSPFTNLLAGFLSALFLLLIHLFTRGKGMGLGDVKFAVLGGFVVGLELLPIWFLIAFLTGGLVGSILILGRVAKLKDKIAFGPFLITAIPITMIYGDKILRLLF